MDTKVKGINLLPKEYLVEQKINFYQKIIGVVAAVEVVCFIGFVALPPKREVVRTQEKLEDLQAQANSARYAGVNKTLSDLETEKNEINTWMTGYQKIQVDGYITSSLLEEMTTRIPGGVTVSSIVMEEARNDDGSSTQQTTINGTAETADEVLSYSNILEGVFPSTEMTHDVTYSESKKLYTYNIEIDATIAAPAAQTEDGSDDQTESDQQNTDGSEQTDDAQSETASTGEGNN